MSDELTSSGLQTKTLSELKAELTAGLKAIYGDDINVEQNSPDGQLINIIAQAGIDIRELIAEVNSSFDPDNAIGSVLDERVAINNIYRKAGTYTIVPISITVDRTVALDGLDGDADDPDGTGFTVQDDAGNQFILLDTSILTAGTTEKNFRAKEIGNVEVTTGTITNPVTIVLGVTGVTNSSGVLEQGENQETDVSLRLRREASVGVASEGYLDGLRGALLQLVGVTEAKVYENPTNATVDTIPAHSIWTVVEGGASDDIASAIYQKKSYGAGMKGDETVNIITASGQTFTAKFDRPEAKDLHIQFDIQRIDATTVFDTDAIKAYIVENLTYNIGQVAETSRATCIIKDAIEAQGGGGYVVNVEISDDGATWDDYLEVDTLDEQWTVDSANIDITELSP